MRSYEYPRELALEQLTRTERIKECGAKIVEVARRAFDWLDRQPHYSDYNTEKIFVERVEGYASDGIQQREARQAFRDANHRDR